VVVVVAVAVAVVVEGKGCVGASCGEKKEKKLGVRWICMDFDEVQITLMDE
jgi:hypothetical protein